MYIAILASFFIFFFFPENEASVLKRRKTYQYDLAICGIFQNDAPYLKEWIEYHQLIGVQHFYLYNNLSTDNFQEILNPYITNGIVDLIDWPYSYPAAQPQEWNKVQCKAYEDAIKRTLHKVRWLAILDTDEFLLPVEEDNMLTLLKDYENIGGVCINWQMYGTSGIARIPSEKLMIEMLTWKAQPSHIENTFVKSIVHPHAVESISDPHHVKYKKNYHQVDTDKKSFKGSRSPSILTDKIIINHYWSRDEDFFYRVKCPRRQNMGEGYDGQLLRLQSLNEVEDHTILRFVPRLRKQIGL